MQVRKVVIPAAGWGTRFLPMSKTQPKEMLPLNNKPLIQYAVEEARSAGISQVVIITAPGKQSIAEYFAPSPGLEALLKSRGETGLARELTHLYDLADFTYVIQKERLGLGHAVLLAKEAIGDEPFAVILPDDIVDSRQSVLEQMLVVFAEYQSCVIAVEPIDSQDTRKYGVICPERVAERVYQVLSLVEKPEPEVAPSRLGIVGRYILTPEVFEAIRRTAPDGTGEVQLTDALALCLRGKPIYALEFEGQRDDAGNPSGWLEAQVAFGLKHPELGDRLRERLRRLV